MKLHHLIVFSALLGGAVSSGARAEIIDLTTVSGKTYRQCRVVQIDPDGVMFRHSNGAGKVLFKDLTKELREHFNFDPEKLKAHEEQVKAEKAKLREITEQRAREMMKQRQEAVDLALDRQALYALQQAAAVAQSNQGQGGFYSNLGGFVTLGDAFDGRDYSRASHGNRRNALNWYAGQLNLGGWSSGGCYPAGNWGFNPVANCGGFTPRPFFAVPGIGPNVAPLAACPPRGLHTRSVVLR